MHEKAADLIHRASPGHIRTFVEYVEAVALCGVTAQRFSEENQAQGQSESPYEVQADHSRFPDLSILEFAGGLPAVGAGVGYAFGKYEGLSFEGPGRLIGAATAVAGGWLYLHGIASAHRDAKGDRLRNAAVDYLEAWDQYTAIEAAAVKAVTEIAPAEVSEHGPYALLRSLLELEAEHQPLERGKELRQHGAQVLDELWPSVATASGVPGAPMPRVEVQYADDLGEATPDEIFLGYPSAASLSDPGLKRLLAHEGKHNAAGDNIAIPTFLGKVRNLRDTASNAAASTIIKAALRGLRGDRSDRRLALGAIATSLALNAVVHVATQKAIEDEVWLREFTADEVANNVLTDPVERADSARETTLTSERLQARRGQDPRPLARLRRQLELISQGLPRIGTTRASQAKRVADASTWPREASAAEVQQVASDLSFSGREAKHSTVEGVRSRRRIAEVTAEVAVALSETVATVTKELLPSRSSVDRYL